MMHDIILIWVLSWISLFTAVVYWPRKPLLPVTQSWHPAEDDLRRLRESADKAYDETKNEPINDDWFKAEQQWHPTAHEPYQATRRCEKSLIDAAIKGHKEKFSRQGDFMKICQICGKEITNGQSRVIFWPGDAHRTCRDKHREEKKRK